MMDKQHIEEFLDYNFIPFNKKQCIKRILFIWIFSAIVCFLDNRYVFWILPLGCVDVFISIFFAVLIVKYSELRISRYLFDGIFWLYISVILDVAAYRLLTLYTGSNWMLLIMLMSLLIVCILIFAIIVFQNIKSGKYARTYSNKLPIWSFCGGVLGIFVARVFLQSLSQEGLTVFLSYLLLVLSLMTSVGSVSLVKAFLHKKLGHSEKSR
jgi:uncharacterized membrane protein YdcZ (DUF606 family)